MSYICMCMYAYGCMYISLTCLCGDRKTFADVCVLFLDIYLLLTCSLTIRSPFLLHPRCLWKFLHVLHPQGFDIFNHILVGGFTPSWKIWKSIGMMTFPIWKNKNMFQSPPTIMFRPPTDWGCLMFKRPSLDPENRQVQSFLASRLRVPSPDPACICQRSMFRGVILNTRAQGAIHCSWKWWTVKLRLFSKCSGKQQ